MNEPMETYNESVTKSYPTAYPFNWLQTTTWSIQNKTTENKNTDWWPTTQEDEIWVNDTTTESIWPFRDDTQLEVALNMMFAAVFIIAIFTGNILLLAVIWKFKLLHPCNRLIRTLIVVNDMLIAIAGGNLITSTSALNRLYPNLFCMINTKVTVFCLGVPINLTALLAIERYILIVHPMRYLAWVKKTKVVLSCICILASPIIFLTGNSILYEDVAYIHVSLLCTHKQKHTFKGQSFMFLLLVVLPGIVIICVAVIKLGLFLKKFAVNSSEAIDAKKAIKLILLLSGALFITFVPSYFLRLAIFKVFSKDELNSGVNIPAFITVRCTSFILCFVSSASNPIIQFYVEKDLWAGLLKIIGRKAYFAYQIAVLKSVNVNHVDVLESVKVNHVAVLESVKVNHVDVLESVNVNHVDVLESVNVNHLDVLESVKVNHVDVLESVNVNQADVQESVNVNHVDVFEPVKVNH